MISELAVMSRVAGISQTYVDDVFSAYNYTGSASNQTFTTGIDLSTNGGMIWEKARSTIYAHQITSSATGYNKVLDTASTGAISTDSPANFSVSTTGFTVTGGTIVNNAGQTHVAWTFRNAPKFYTHSVEVKAAGVSKTVDLSTLGTVGMVRVKRTDIAGSWYIWHRSLTAGKLLIGETTAAEATLGHITVSGTTLTLVDGVIADGTYLVEAWAHDTSA